MSPVPPPPNSGLDPVTLVIAATISAALAGAAAVLRSSQRLTLRIVIGAMLNAGALGGGMSMLLFTYFKDNTWFLLGLCLLAGLGGMTLIGFILQILKRGGIHVDVHLTQTHEDKNDDFKA